MYQERVHEQYERSRVKIESYFWTMALIWDFSIDISCEYNS